MLSLGWIVLPADKPIDQPQKYQVIKKIVGQKVNTIEDQMRKGDIVPGNWRKVLIASNNG